MKTITVCTTNKPFFVVGITEMLLFVIVVLTVGVQYILCNIKLQSRGQTPWLKCL